MDVEKRVADYFIISGISENFEHNSESKPYTNPALPITDITVIFKGLGEQCPIGYECIETTPGGHVADLNNGNFKSPDIHICYKRGTDRPPIVDVGVYHEGKDYLLSNVELVSETPYGRCASTGNHSSKNGTYITYRRAKTRTPYNQLVVVDLCIIFNNKSEHAPHAYYAIKKNLNKSYYGMIGSEVFLCYKKTFLSPPSICFTPQIVSRFPLQDYANFPLPDRVPLFCLPAGANIELRPSSIPLPRPVFSTFVLTSDSAQKMYGSAVTFYEFFDKTFLTPDQKARLGIVAENGTEDDVASRSSSETSGRSPSRQLLWETFACKSICILSRWPFFDCFEKFLMFLHKLVFSPNYDSSNPNSPTHRSNIALEHHISHFLLDVSFPTPQRPTVMVQLIPGTDETVSISQPSSRLPLPLTGASFIQLLSTLGVDNTMNVLLFGLCEQQILLHSLNLWLLTGVAEAITAMLFPFHWQCPYVPLCPLDLLGIINAPMPFIVGIDSRCFDTFTPPDDVICIDLDTKSIFLSESKKCLNARILPKRAARVLRNTLDKVFQKYTRVSQAIGANQSPQHRSPVVEKNRQHLEKKLELEIQEAFIRFMASILRGFRSYLLPITRAPTVGATDPTSLFNFEGFLSSRDRSYSQFYQYITKTQMFTHYIEERSFASDKDTSLAFFDDCEEKLISSDDIFSDKPIKLFDQDDGIIQTDRSVFIPAPEQSPSISTQYDAPDSVDGLMICGARATRTAKSHNGLWRRYKFGPLDTTLFHRHPQTCNLMSLNRAMSCADGGGDASNTNGTSSFDELMFSENFANTNNLNNTFSISRRTKQEIKTCQRMARKSADSPLDWSKYLVSCCYCLWFSILPSYISYCKRKVQPTIFDASAEKLGDGTMEEDKSTGRMLRYAYSTIVRMQKLQLTTDEICFRILTLLCGYYGQPALAVRVFFEMKKAGIKPNAITYGYYNKAVLESRWPDHSSKPTTVLWTKIRNVISGIALFKSHGRLRRERRNRRSIQLIGDPNFYNYEQNFATDTSMSSASTVALGVARELFRPTTLPINHHDGRRSDINQHRRSLVNRSFSTNKRQSTLGLSADMDNDDSLLIDEGGPHLRTKNAIHKSFSMHLRNDISPDRQSNTGVQLLNSSSMDDDEDQSQLLPPPPVVQKLSSNHADAPAGPNASLPITKKITSTHDLFLTLMERHQLLIDTESDQSILKHVDLADNMAGLLFSTNPEICRKVTRSVSQNLIQTKDGDEKGEVVEHQQSINLMLLQPELVTGSAPNQPNQNNSHNHQQPEAALLDTSCFGEDAKILNKIQTREQKPDFSESIDNFEMSGLIQGLNLSAAGCDVSSSEDAKNADQMSESLSERDNSTNESDSVSMDNMISTPNFKLANLINDASNLHWSKWTSSQNSKSVYKGIKNAATGIVSQLQEIKSSFSNTPPAKLLTSVQHKSTSTTTREMLSQWANYFSSQPSRAGDDLSDTSSEHSNDLLRLSNEEDMEPSSAESNDFRFCHKLFVALDKHYNNSQSKEDLVDHLTRAHEDSTMLEDKLRVAIEIKMTTCSRCNVCHSLLYDEEIMERWSHNESNLNTKCIYCRAKIVPLMSIDVDDHRFSKDHEAQPELGSCNLDGVGRHPEAGITNDLVDLGEDPSGARSKERKTSRSSSCCQQNFTVPYLSPIVLRKELENVFESSGDNCPASSRFIDEHPIIFWNLLWYFTRINVPTHLALLCLNAKSILNGRSVPESAKALDKVLVRTLWDNDKLYAQVGKPLYRLLQRGEPSRQVQAILCDDLHFTRSFLDRVIILIKSNELQKAMELVLNARLKSSPKFSFDKNRHNLYRDLIFLINTYFGPGKLHMDNFEREYKKAFEGLSFQQVALNRFDRPPTIGSLFCRKCFKEPSLIK